MALPFPLALENGGTAEIVKLDGEQVTLHSTVPKPPGSFLSGTSGEGSPFRFKVRGCKRLGTTEPPSFCIEARTIDLTRAQRELVEGK